MIDYSNDPRVVLDDNGTSYTLRANDDGPDWHVRLAGGRWYAARSGIDSPRVWVDTPDLAIYHAIGNPQAG